MATTSGTEQTARTEVTNRGQTTDSGPTEATEATEATEPTFPAPPDAAAPASSGITALALRRIRPLSADWAAVLAAAALAVAVSLGWKVTW